MSTEETQAPSLSPVDERWYSRKVAAAYLTQKGCRISARTLEKYASNNNSGKGPPFTRFRWKAVSYREADLDAWAEKQIERVE